MMINWLALLVCLPLLFCRPAKAETLKERSFPASEPYVKLTGRTALNNGVRWLIHSASKAEFRFRGTRAAVVIAGDGSVSGEEASQARLAVYLNGKRVIDHLVGQAEETLEIFSSDREIEAEVCIIKLSEAANSVFGIRRIDVTSAGDIEALPQKDLKIEFIGDSITCGYGVDDEDANHHFVTGTEDATRAYAYKTAAALNADYSLVCYSGHGIISGYTGDGNRVSGQLVPPVYEQLGKNYGSAASVIDLSQPWDFSAFQPDVVVINLGTNDQSFTGSSAERREEFTASYAEFLKTVRKNNPSALIMAVYGVMGDDLFLCVQEAVRRYSEETGDAHIQTLWLKPQDGSTGYVADWHPTEATQEQAAQALIERLSSLLKGTSD